MLTLTSSELILDSEKGVKTSEHVCICRFGYCKFVYIILFSTVPRPDCLVNDRFNISYANPTRPAASFSSPAVNRLKLTKISYFDINLHCLQQT